MGNARTVRNFPAAFSAFLALAGNTPHTPPILPLALQAMFIVLLYPTVASPWPFIAQILQDLAYPLLPHLYPPSYLFLEAYRLSLTVPCALLSSMMLIEWSYRLNFSI